MESGAQHSGCSDGYAAGCATKLALRMALRLSAIGKKRTYLPQGSLAQKSLVTRKKYSARLKNLSGPYTTSESNGR